jgi:hypothetical protein
MSRRGTVLSLAVVAASIAVPLALALGSIAVLMRHCPPSTDDESPGSAIISVR